MSLSSYVVLYVLALDFCRVGNPPANAFFVLHICNWLDLARLSLYSGPRSPTGRATAGQ
jgi:hypothetical protein